MKPKKSYSEALRSVTGFALIGPGLVIAFRDIRAEKATGIAVLAGRLAEALFSPGFWLLALVGSALFWGASRLDNKFLRIVFFWTPTIFIATITCALIGLFSYVQIRKG